jgi:hypothetical protein
MKFNKLMKNILIISVLFLPIIVFASNGENIFSLADAIGIEVFVSVHMSLFVLKPLSEIFSKENSKNVFWILFFIRAIILIFCDLFVTTSIAIVDFICVFIGAFAIVPICALITKTNISSHSNQVISNTNNINIKTLNTNQINGIELKCAKCNSLLKINDKFCPNCGSPFDQNNVIVSENSNSSISIPQKEKITPSNFDSIYSLSENMMIEEFIKKELVKAGIDNSMKLVPNDILKRKNILNIIFSILVFVYISLIFFHFPIYTYVIGLIILIVFYRLTRKYNLIKYLTKQIKERPGEKISNIVMNVKNSFVNDNTKSIFIVSMLIAILLPLIIFSTPKIIYEKTDGGYAVRYYMFGLTNFKSASIPEMHNNEPIVSLRGNTFSNMPFLESVNLPDTIVEIRGQAFKNCYKLQEINIPNNLEYLGGGAFYNAQSIKNIELPDTLTYLGGESFYGATSLESVKLSNNLTEIRGDSFEYCTSLKKIIIPDNIVRIGGHAFYGDSSLSEVRLTSNSKLNEIGSSAFRQCYNLYSITIPRTTHVNERAFKESPTTIQYFNDNESYYNNSNYNYNSYYNN